jgi:hypothetical protein
MAQAALEKTAAEDAAVVKQHGQQSMTAGELATEVVEEFMSISDGQV